MYARYRLKTRGHLTMYNAVPKPMVDTMRVNARLEKHLWIHDPGDSTNYDLYRIQTFVPDPMAIALMDKLKVFNRKYFPDSTLSDMPFLKAFGNAPDPLPRREFPPVAGPESLNVCSVPGMIFIATQDSTYFYVYGWNNHVPLRSSQQLVELNKGDILMLRGDCIYAMAGGEATNLCIQAYIDVPLCARPNYQVPEVMNVEDDTRDAVDEMFCFVWNCPYISGTKQSLYKHLNNYHHFYFNQPREIMP